MWGIKSRSGRRPCVGLIQKTAAAIDTRRAFDYPPTAQTIRFTSRRAMSEVQPHPQEIPQTPAPPHESPLRRNWIWFSFQKVAQVLFAVWFRARTRGIEHLPKEGPALILMNHESFLDPLVTGVWLTRPISFLARHDLFRVPIVGWILRRTYVTPINRKKGSSAAMRATIERLEQGFWVGIFPEGARTADGELGEIKPGFLAITRRVPVPIVPVGISGTRQAMALGTFFPKPYSVRVVIGEPIDAEQVARLSSKEHQAEMLELIKSRLLDCRTAAKEWPQLNQSSPS